GVLSANKHAIVLGDGIIGAPRFLTLLAVGNYDFWLVVCLGFRFRYRFRSLFGLLDSCLCRSYFCLKLGKPTSKLSQLLREALVFDSKIVLVLVANRLWGFAVDENEAAEVYRAFDGLLLLGIGG